MCPPPMTVYAPESTAGLHQLAGAQGELLPFEDRRPDRTMKTVPAPANIFLNFSTDLGPMSKMG